MRTLGIVAMIVLGANATALGQGHFTPPNYTGQSGKISWSMVVKFGKSGKPVRVMQFGWEGYPCQGDRYTGGSSKSIKVSGGKFSSTQLIEGVQATFTVRGKFSADAKKASGTVKLTGCGSAKTWSVKRTSRH